MAGYTVLGIKHGSFKNKDGQDVAFHQLALDCGSYLKVFSVKAQQSDLLDALEPGTVLESDNGFTADKYFIFT